jgi:hypothetical protein
MSRPRELLGIALALIALVALPAGANEEAEEQTEDGGVVAVGAPPPGEDRPLEAEEPEDPTLVVYVPPSRGAARVRAGAGTRGVEAAEVPRIEVLAPDHVGLTLREQPTLVWFLSDPSDARVDFTLIGADAIDPIAEVTLDGPFERGVHLVRLTDLGVRLAPEAVYEWSVALVVDPARRDRDVYAGGALHRTVVPELAEVAGATQTTVDALARRGVWYDAIAEISEAIATRPEDRSLRAQRAALLAQVGLEAAAAHDRGAGDRDE